jgi:hypothetical protein
MRGVEDGRWKVEVREETELEDNQQSFKFLSHNKYINNENRKAKLVVTENQKCMSTPMGVQTRAIG